MSLSSFDVFAFLAYFVVVGIVVVAVSRRERQAKDYFLGGVVS